MIADNKPNVKCNNCKVEFYKTKSQIKRSKSGKHYCSRSCSASTNNLSVQRNKPKIYTCEYCNNNYHRTQKNRSTKICNDCLLQNPGNYFSHKTSKIKKKTIEEYSYENNIHPSWKFSRIRGLNRSWNKELLSLPCQVCGYTAHIELAHIKPLSSFEKETPLHIVNDPSNILVLCPNHHWEFDNDKICLSDIPTRPPLPFH